jgi:hypothetical protein
MNPSRTSKLPPLSQIGGDDVEMMADLDVFLLA